jgi:hypothetical protein
MLTSFVLAEMLLLRRGPGDVERARELLAEVRAESLAMRIPGPIDGRAHTHFLLRVADELGIGSTVRQELAAPGAAAPAAAGARARRAGAPPARRRLTRRASHAADRAMTAVRLQGLAGLARIVHGTPDEELERRFGSPVAQRALFTTLAISFQPAKAFGFEGDIDFELTHQDDRRPPDEWTVRVIGRRARARRGSSERPAVRVRLSLPDFVRLVAGELNPVGSLIEGQTEVEGDLPLASRLVEMFGGVSPEA